MRFGNRTVRVRHEQQEIISRLRAHRRGDGPGDLIRGLDRQGLVIVARCLDECHIVEAGAFVTR